MQSYDIIQIDIDELHPDPDQARKYFDSDIIQEMSDSIQEAGLQNPIKYIESDGKKIIVSGEIRWRAAKQAGLATVPAILISDANEATKIALIDNISQHKLLPMEEALALQNYINEQHINQEEACKQLAIPKSSMSEKLLLTKLPEDIQKEALSEPLWIAQKLRKLARIEDNEERNKLFLTMKDHIEKKKNKETKDFDAENVSISQDKISKQERRIKRVEKSVGEFKISIQNKISRLFPKEGANSFDSELQAISSALDLLIKKINEVNETQGRIDDK